VPRLVAVDETVLKVNVMMVEVVQEMKDRTKRSCNSINAKTLKSLEELATAIAAMHNIIRPGKEEVIPPDSTGPGRVRLIRGCRTVLSWPR
jgi:hypothetical protein